MYHFNKERQKNMKKALALLLALLMVISLVACGSKTDDSAKEPETNKPADADTNEPADDGNSDTPDAATATPNMNEDGTMNLDKIAHYDQNYDYSQNEKFKFVYMAWNADILYQQSADAYEHWCSKYNLDWQGFISAGNDGDMFMTNLQTYLDQGCEMFVMDPDITVFPTIADMMSNYPDVVWMSQMGTARASMPDGDMLAPFVGFDFYNAGVVCAEKLIEWKEANHPDVPWSEFGFIGLTLTLSPPLHLRTLGAQEAFMGIEGVTEDQYFEIDVASFGLTLQGAVDGTTPVLTTNDYKYWLIFGNIDDLAMGAAQVVDQMGLTDNCCIDCIGGPGLQTQLDAGQHTAFRYAYATPNLLYAEPIIGALYSFKMGWATPDTLWPSWVKASDHGGEGHSYANLLLPSWFIDESNYKDFYAWTDMYADCDYYGYDQSNVTIDSFSPFIDVPDGWND